MIYYLFFFNNTELKRNTDIVLFIDDGGETTIIKNRYGHTSTHEKLYYEQTIHAVTIDKLLNNKLKFILGSDKIFGFEISMGELIISAHVMDDCNILSMKYENGVLKSADKTLTPLQLQFLENLFEIK